MQKMIKEDEENIKNGLYKPNPEYGHIMETDLSKLNNKLKKNWAITR